MQPDEDYPWVGTDDQRFTLALVLDVAEVLARHGYHAVAGEPLVELTACLYRTLHPPQPWRPPHPDTYS